MSAIVRTAPAFIDGRQLRKLAPLAAIILLHAGFFYALQSGLLRQAVLSLPKEVFVSFITPEPVAPPEPPKPKTAPPKTLPALKQAIAPPLPPVLNTMPSEQAIAVPAQVPEAPAPVVAAPLATTPAQPAPAVAAPPKTIASGVEYLQAPQPEYPSISRRMREEGKVVLRVLVNEKGRAERVDVQQSSGASRLDEAARQAALRALFKPHLEDGKAVPVYAIVPIRFQLD